jgi:arsenate reductase
MIREMLRVYAYAKCDSCRRALRWLKENDVPHEVVAIRESPPTPAELRTAAAMFCGTLRSLFNTSGTDYRQLGIKDRLPELSETEAIKLLAGNGNLVKRPFVVGDGIVLVGFDEARWRERLLASH